MHAFAQSGSNNSFTIDLPPESGIYWYPLAFYFDYYYMFSANDLVLKIDESAPQSIKDNFPGVTRLSDLYDYADNEQGKNLGMYLQNLAVTTKLKSMGLVTWDTYYNKKDVAENFAKLRNAMDDIERNIVEKRSEDVDINLLDNIVEYADDQDAVGLVDIGMGYKMNQYMKKVVDVKYHV